MKIRKLFLVAFLVITSMIFTNYGASASDNYSAEKAEGIGTTENEQTGDDVTIGTQIWTTKNLDVSTYRNGDIIPQVQDKTAWANLTTGAWCYFENDTANGTTYGKLYNWFAVNDPRGLAPTGYHIPSEAEWITLITYLGGTRGAGKKMKNTSGWKNDGNGTNISGFSGLPGGMKYSLAGFNSIGTNGYWWSSTSIPEGTWAYFISLNKTHGIVTSDYIWSETGFSVRCIKD
jgi:uncharacterized protein (TIGR02145 family)